MAKLTTEEFIAKAKAVHGDRYDYSKVEYVGTKSPVIIICKEHGEFQQTPQKHLAGQGCIKCHRKAMAKRYSLGMISQRDGSFVISLRYNLDIL